MSTLLEQRYRRILRVLPASYRRLWEEDMVATFLEGAYAAMPEDPEGVDISRPSLAEVASVVRLAVRLRLGGVDAAPRPRLLGDAVRLLATMALLVFATTGVASVVINAWVALRLPGVQLPPEAYGFPSGWQVFVVWPSLLWLVALLAVLSGQFRAAQVFAALAFGVRLATIAADRAQIRLPPSLSDLVDLLTMLAVVLAMAAFHTGAPRLRARPWLIAFAVAAVVQSVTALLVVTSPSGYVVLVDWVGLWCIALVAVSVTRQFVGPRAPRWHSSPWSLALALAAGLLLLWRLATAVYLFEGALGDDGRGVGMVIVAAQVAAVAMVGLSHAGQAWRDWHDLPPGYAVPTAEKGVRARRVSRGSARPPE